MKSACVCCAVGWVLEVEPWVAGGTDELGFRCSLRASSPETERIH